MLNLASVQVALIIMKYTNLADTAMSMTVWYRIALVAINLSQRMKKKPNASDVLSSACKQVSNMNFINTGCVEIKLPIEKVAFNRHTGEVLYNGELIGTGVFKGNNLHITRLIKFPE